MTHIYPCQKLSLRQFLQAISFDQNNFVNILIVLIFCPIKKTSQDERLKVFPPRAGHIILSDLAPWLYGCRPAFAGSPDVGISKP